MSVCGGEPAALDALTVVDEQWLGDEFLAGLDHFMEVPLSVTHQFVLCVAANHALASGTCPEAWRPVLQEFVTWCAKRSGFPAEMRKLLAAQSEEPKEPQESKEVGV